jgi:hypothetical protein
LSYIEVILGRVPGVVLISWCSLGLSAELPETIEFNRDIRPILSNNCFQCHGPDGETRGADLRLDIREHAIASNSGQAAIVPGNADASNLLDRILHKDPEEVMPPSDTERSLSDHEKALLQKWIEQGAEYQAHWAYIPPKKISLPTSAVNPIDYLVKKRLIEEGLNHSPEADRVTLIRRLSLDLLGLPPKPDEVAAFVNDTRPDAYEQLVNRLLASEHYGERMTIYWLDLVRYADTVGYHGDQVRGMSPYRDYVINAFNSNISFDQFTREQIAGDLLDNPTQEQKIATGYNRLNMVTREGGAQAKDYLVRYAADRVRTTSSVWLGSSMGCSECHDHKFDPFTMKDFYSFASFFADIKEDGVQTYGGNDGPFPPLIPFPNEAEAKKFDGIDSEIAKLKAIMDIAIPNDAEDKEALQKERDDAKNKHRTLSRQRIHLERDIVSVAVTETMEPRMMRILPRGNWLDETGEAVTPAIPTFLGTLEKKDDRLTRLDLADWLTHRNNPLTARVFVNRLWKLYFGTGISRVLDDVGSQGEWPQHPELLDYLAADFMDSGWDIKYIIKQIVMSQTYCQSSMPIESIKDTDPYNRLLARQSRFRLEAELVRDNALSVSGLLVTKVGGRSVKPYQPSGHYRELNFPVRTYQQDSGENLYRRGVYTHWQRTFLHPSLIAFDAPTREECTAERTISNSPQQALVLLNDPIYVEASRVFAERIITEGGDDIASRIHWAFQEAFSREPLERELAIVSDLYIQHFKKYRNDAKGAKALIGVGEKPVHEGLRPVELAAWTSVARTLFNLHEMIYRY